MVLIVGSLSVAWRANTGCCYLGASCLSASVLWKPIRAWNRVQVFRGYPGSSDSKTLMNFELVGIPRRVPRYPAEILEGGSSISTSENSLFICKQCHQIRGFNCISVPYSLYNTTVRFFAFLRLPIRFVSPGTHCWQRLEKLFQKRNHSQSWSILRSF